MSIIRDSRGDKANVDAISSALVGIDSVHARIHEGRFFSAEVQELSLSNGEFMDMLVVVPAGVFPHVRFQTTFSAQSRAYFYEDTQSVPASPENAIAARNRNRNSSNTSQLSIYSAPTLSSPLGTLLFDAALPGGQRRQAFGGQSNTFEEWILKPDTSYLVRLENTSGGNNEFANIFMDWYE